MIAIIFAMIATQIPFGPLSFGNNPPPVAPGGQGGQGGQGGASVVPPISARSYSGGSTPVTVTGAFGINTSVALEAPASLSDGQKTWLNYGIDQSTGMVGIELTEDGIGLNIGYGSWYATYMGEGCTWDVDVADTVVSGHISCSDIGAVNEEDGSTGTVSIELDFTANS